MLDPQSLAWDKMDQLLPAVVQDAFNGRVLMQGFMNPQALQATVDSGRVTFWSRSKQRLWTKGETSGHHLELVAIDADCDGDCLLVMARPAGPTCHLGTPTCFDRNGTRAPALAFLATLEETIRERDRQRPPDSYTTQLLQSGVRRMAQKVGEEGVETALAGAAGDDGELLNEAADLLYHLLVLMRGRNLDLAALVSVLTQRHGP